MHKIKGQLNNVECRYFPYSKKTINRHQEAGRIQECAQEDGLGHRSFIVLDKYHRKDYRQDKV